MPMLLVTLPVMSIVPQIPPRTVPFSTLIAHSIPGLIISSVLRVMVCDLTMAISFEKTA